MQNTTDQKAHDPVCHMDIAIAEAAGSSDHNGLTYYFCSRGCKVDFDADPEGVLEAEGKHDHSQPVDHTMGGGSASAPTATASASSGAGSSEKKPWWQFWR